MMTGKRGPKGFIWTAQRLSPFVHVYLMPAGLRDRAFLAYHITVT
jgi:hypothetical protein